MAKKTTKAAAVLEMLNKGMSSKQIRERFNVSASYVWKMKQNMAHKEEKEDLAEKLYQISRGRQAREADKLKETIAVWRKEPEIDEVLTERGNRYGDFMGHAEVTQQLKNVMMAHLIKKRKTLVVDQQEALEMIFHKVGRIVNGDPDYVDSWVDIAGYAKLVADRLQGQVR